MYEPDQRHAEILVRELGLGLTSNSVNTPGNNETSDDDTPSTPQEATRYRALAARANYLAHTRPELLYAAKELSRSMAAPRAQDWPRLKR
eukprot:gene1352-biopygen880